MALLQGWRLAVRPAADAAADRRLDSTVIRVELRIMAPSSYLRSLRGFNWGDQHQNQQWSKWWGCIVLSDPRIPHAPPIPPPSAGPRAFDLSALSGSVHGAPGNSAQLNMEAATMEPPNTHNHMPPHCHSRQPGQHSPPRPFSTLHQRQPHVEGPGSRGSPTAPPRSPRGLDWGNVN